MNEVKEMNSDDIINNYQKALNGQPSWESLENGRDETLKKVFDAKVLAKLKDRIVATYQVLADVSRGRRKVPAGKVAMMAGGLAYLALPFDLVCDAIPVAGLIDDGIVLTWIFTQCADVFMNGAEKRQNMQKDENHEKSEKID